MWAAKNKERRESNGAAYRNAHRAVACAKSKAWYQANRDYVLQRDRVDNWERKLVIAATGAAKSRGHECAIDVAFVKGLFAAQAGRCYWTNIELVPSVVRADPQKPSLDRLDNAIGYVPGNCVLSCWFANRGRGEATAERFAAFMALLREAIRAA